MSFWLFLMISNVFHGFQGFVQLFGPIRIDLDQVSAAHAAPVPTTCPTLYASEVASLGRRHWNETIKSYIILHQLLYIRNTIYIHHPKYRNSYIQHHGGVYRKCFFFTFAIWKVLHFTAVCIYTTKWTTPAVSLFFLSPNPVVVYIFGVLNLQNRNTKSQDLVCRSAGLFVNLP